MHSGTHVAGTIAPIDNEIYVAGVAPGAAVIVKIFVISIIGIISDFATFFANHFYIHYLHHIFVHM